MGLTIRTLEAPAGAEVTGLDLSEDVPPALIGSFRAALADRGVLIFRDQANLTPAQHVAFSRHFGPLEIHVQSVFLHASHPEILIISNVIENGRPIGLADAGRYWHSDLSYMEKPSLGSLLHALELPDEGGDTLFANMAAVYDAIPEDIKIQIEGLTAVHSYDARNALQAAQSGSRRPQLSEEQRAKVPPAIHPLVTIHPESGRKTLFVSEGFTTRIVELPEPESAALLRQLFDLSTGERFIYRHRWQPHDLVFWDNRQMIHLATPFPAHYRRKLHRTTVRGEVPQGAVTQ